MLAIGTACARSAQRPLDSRWRPWRAGDRVRALRRRRRPRAAGARYAAHSVGEADAIDVLDESDRIAADAAAATIPNILLDVDSEFGRARRSARMRRNIQRPWRVSGGRRIGSRAHGDSASWASRTWSVEIMTDLKMKEHRRPGADGVKGRF